ncbi:MAG: histidinol-phosphate transaminase [Saprospiraceae bacterium]|nr:histidinol-phosphate transaminase [Saprospiraceae bacterium]
MRDIHQLVRENILLLEPYRSARDEYSGDRHHIFLDANENPFESGYNRYPDPYQKKLKSTISEWKNIDAEHIFLGNGSDEIIDLLIRIFCYPGKDKIMSLNPSYGMYKVSADINHVQLVNFNLDKNFEFDTEELLEKASDNNIKILFICSPNNPSGNAFEIDKITKVCEKFRGIIVVDEAYSDFSEKGSMMNFIHHYQNLVVMQTLSKAMGAAALRLGMAFTSTDIIRLLNKVKPPYNINSATQTLAMELIKNRAKNRDEIRKIKEHRKMLEVRLKAFDSVLEVYPSDANFLLVKVDDADQMYQFLLGKNIVVRNRNKAYGCSNCLRITIGNSQENEQLLDAFYVYSKTKEPLPISKSE